MKTSSTGSNGQCLLAFTPVGKHHVTLPAPSVTAGRVFPGLTKQGCFGFAQEHCVLARHGLAGTQCPCQKDPDVGEAAGETGEPSVLSYKPTLPCAHSMACP